MTYSEEDNARPVSGGFTRAELDELPDYAAIEVIRGRLTKVEWQRRQAAAAEKAEAQETLPSSPSQEPYAPTAWGSDLYDFTVPSGQLCQMRNLNETLLLEAGILDQVTRLPGIVMAGPVAQGQGKPPTPPGMDIMGLLKDTEKFKDMMSVMNRLVAVVVVQPRVRAEVTEEAPLLPGEVLVTSINLGDRIAIMERAMGGITKLDNFREGSSGAE